MGDKIGRLDAVKRKTNTSGHTGVYYIKATQKYQAAITFNYRLFSLGMYADIEDAVRAREEANMHIKEGDFIEWYERVHPKQYACFLEDRILTNGGKRRSALDLTGQKYGKLTVLRSTEERRGTSVVWKCRCECGKIHYASSHNLRNGLVKSCGCGKGRINPTGIVGVHQLKDGRYSYTATRKRKNFYFGIFDNLEDIRKIDALVRNMSADDLAEYHARFKQEKRRKKK